jgi:hypothetical protein
MRGLLCTRSVALSKNLQVHEGPWEKAMLLADNRLLMYMQVFGESNAPST